MKTLAHLLLIALLAGSSGCMTQSAIRAAQAPAKHKDEASSHPAYYLLLPLTLPADVAFAPFEAVGWYYGQMCVGGGGAH